MCGYLKAYVKARIDVDTSIPGLQGEAVEHDQIEIYQGVKEVISMDMPPKEGISEVLNTYVDADNTVCTETRRSVSGVLLLVKNTPTLLVQQESEHSSNVYICFLVGYSQDCYRTKHGAQVPAQDVRSWHSRAHYHVW